MPDHIADLLPLKPLVLEIRGDGAQGGPERGGARGLL